MAIVLTSVTIKGAAALPRKEVNDIVKTAWHLTARRWRHRYLPLHFGPRATQRYGYTLRSGAETSHDARRYRRSYSARKVRFLGHNNPLEFTGEGKREALSRESIVATRKEARVRLPRKFNWRHPSSQVRMADEIRAVREDEARSLTKFLADTIRDDLRKSGATRATVVARVS